jgi:DNA-binding MarR family transcriptional regulator
LPESIPSSGIAKLPRAMATGSGGATKKADRARPGSGVASGDHVDHIIEAWAKELPGLETDAIALIGRVLRASRLLQLEVDRTLENFGLTINEFNTLNALRRAGPPYRLSPKQVGVSLLFSSGGLTKLLERLESRGLVAREPDPNDGRGVLVSLTSDGMDLQQRAMAAHQVNEEELLTPLTDEQRESLNAILRQLLTAFEASAGRMRPAAPPVAARSAGD